MGTVGVSRRLVWIARACIIALAGLSHAACSDDAGESKPGKPAKASPFSEYAVHVLVHVEGGLAQVDFPPVQSVSAPNTQKTVTAIIQPGPSSKPLVDIQVDGGTKTLETDSELPLLEPGWALLMRAVAQCRNPYEGRDVPLKIGEPWKTKTTPTWSGNWYVYRDKLASDGKHLFESCEILTRAQEELLCAAAKLEEAATTLVPVIWEAISTNTASFPTDPQYPSWMRSEWVILPQSQKDKFILRDLAINALAHVARLELEVPNPPSPSSAPSLPLPTNETCTDIYVESAADGGQKFTDHAETLYWVDGMWNMSTPPHSYFSNELENTSGNREELAETRLRFKTHILRTSGRLLKTLIDDSVIADLAGAERQRALAGDAKRGPELFWGARTDGDAPYNSLAHAFRVVFGRWETTRPEGWPALPAPSNDAALPSPDPACGGLSPIELLVKADGSSPLGPGQSARWQDKRVMTDAQRFATRLVDASGIVIPKHQLDVTDFEDIQPAVFFQALVNALAANDPDVDISNPNLLDDPIIAARLQTHEALAGRIKPPDLRFALNRAWNNYRLATGTGNEGQPVVEPPDPSKPLEGPAGVKLMSPDFLIGALSAVDGNVLVGGQPRYDLAVDIMARVGPGQAASMCPEHWPSSMTFGSANMGKVSTFQDAFLIGDMFRRRLSALRQDIDESSYPTSSDLGATRFPELANMGAAEIRTWTGPGHIAMRYYPGVTTDVEFMLFGLTQEDFVGDLTHEHEDFMKDNLVLVWGKPWVADCAARTRTSCPENFMRDYAQFPNYQVSSFNWGTFTGADGRVMAINFASSGPTECGTAGPCKFQPATTPLSSESTDFLYLVALHDPGNPGKGRVLATFPYYAASGGYRSLYSLISTHQRKLANDLFGVSRAFGNRAPGNGEPSAAEPPGYCIEGVPRDFFVPLENELISDNDGFEDSWAHYLAAAKSASSRADELANKMIDLGLQMDFRREAANEEVAQICGEFGAVDDAEFENSQVKAPDDNATLSNCLGEDTYDMVFLTTEPPTKKDNGSALDVREIIGCNQNPADPVAESSPLCKAYGDHSDDEELRENMAGLGFATYFDPSTVVPPAETPPSCEQALKVVESATSAFDGHSLQALASDADMNTDSIGSVLHGMRVAVDENLDWSVLFDDGLIMSTTEDDYWPKHTPAQGCQDCPQKALREQFKRIFAYDGGISSSADKDVVLQRVTGAMWLMAAMSGYLPPATFSLPIPARTGFTTNDDPEPAVVLYGKGAFIFQNNKWVLDAASDDQGLIPSEDVSELGEGKVIQSAFASGASSSSTTRPAWIKDIYASDENYLHVMAQNVARKFPEQKTLVDFFTKRGNDLHSIGCSSSPTTAATNASKAILDMKMPYKSDNVSISPGVICPRPDGVGKLLSYYPSGSGIADIFIHREEDEGKDAKHIIPHAKSGWWGEHKWNHDFPDLGCRHDDAEVPNDTVKVSRACLNYAKITGQAPVAPNHNRFTRSALLPSACSKGQRAQVFINSMTPYAHPCNAAQELARTLATTCVLNRTYRPLAGGGALPPLTKPEDIKKLENWIDDQALNARTALSRMYLVDVPKRVVDDFQGGKNPSGAYKGEHGQLVLQYRQHLSTLAIGWQGLEKDFEAIRLSVTSARLGLDAAQLAKEEALKTLAMQHLQIEAQMLKSAVAAAGSIVGAAGTPENMNPFGAGAEAAAAGINAMIDYKYGMEQKKILTEIEGIKNKQAQTQVLQVLTTLQTEVNERFTTIQQTLQSMQSAVAGAFQTASAMKQKQNEAKYHVAKGAGEAYVEIDGKPVKFPVNAVLKRQYDVTKRRYEAALKEAKYMSYMARLAVEQRVGIRMTDMHEPIGALPAPAEWADDVCSFQGVNYEELSKVLTPIKDDDPPMVKIVKSYLRDMNEAKWSDPYIGDYVDRLEKFVEFYNIDYPSHEGDDVAVLSIRDDLLGPQGRCYRPARNLLLFSHDLHKQQGDGDDELGIEGNTYGWVTSGCVGTTDRCLVVKPGSILEDSGVPLAGPGAAPVEGFSWLRDASPDEFQGPNDPGDPPEPGQEPAGVQIPEASVYQQVYLDSGNYVVSWYDRAWGTAADDPPTAASADYRVMVYGPNWEIVASQIGTPHYDSGVSSTSSEAWSTRRSMQLATKQPGPHYVLFGASLAGGSLGSVVIANVQLEQAASTAVASGYEGTDASRLRVSGDCVAGSAEHFRSAFQYGCDGAACFYDLKQPFIIDTRTVDVGESKLIGKLAQGNFNYRHVHLALNVVGTGVTDCSSTPTPSCYGTGYLEYTMQHDAYSAPILSHIPDYQAEFNFGAAYINHGKGLAAERFITLPIGSADLGLLSQPEIQKQEWRGRPLSGAYHLRVYDAPHLVWNQVEDIQVVLTYRYWSRIERESQTK